MCGIHSRVFDPTHLSIDFLVSFVLDVNSEVNEREAESTDVYHKYLHFDIFELYLTKFLQENTIRFISLHLASSSTWYSLKSRLKPHLCENVF